MILEKQSLQNLTFNFFGNIGSNQLKHVENLTHGEARSTVICELLYSDSFSIVSVIFYIFKCVLMITRATRSWMNTVEEYSNSIRDMSNNQESKAQQQIHKFRWQEAEWGIIGKENVCIDKQELKISGRSITLSVLLQNTRLVCTGTNMKKSDSERSCVINIYVESAFLPNVQNWFI